jgi:undecaprenyl-diphosphatase
MQPTLLQVILLGIIQGAAELLPVSSSAHVIAAERIMRLDPSSPEMTFLLAMLHTGTMFAMIAYFWSSWRRTFLATPTSFREAFVPLIAATMATGAVYLVLEFLIKRVVLGGRPGAEVEDLFSNLYLIAASLVAAGALILASGLRARAAEPGSGLPGLSGRTVPFLPAVVIGAVQGVCLPFRGFSRSGATISTGMLLGVPRRPSEEFSFALAVVLTPPVIARELMRLLRARAAAPGGLHLGALVAPGLLGMGCSFLAGLLALVWLSGWLERGRWHYFGIYCFVAAAGVCILARMGH